MVLELFFGLSLGYNYAHARKKEMEVKQGKSEYQASAYQIQELSGFSSLASRILAQIPYAPLRTGAQIGNALLPAAGVVFCPTAAAIKQGHYEQGVQCLNTVMEPYCPTLTGLLPEKVDEARVKLFSFLSENAGRITSVGMLVGSVALPFLGFGALAAGMAAPIVFEALNTANLVPVSVSEKVEKYMPTIANASMLVGGGVFTQALSLVALSSGIPGASDYVQKKIEKIFLRNFAGPTLEEIDAPWEERTDLTFEEVNYILNNHEDFHYEINPAHCSKESYTGVNIPQDQDFKKFLEIFKTINWKENYHLIKPSFQDDDRFLDLLRQSFPEKSNEELQVDFEIYLEEVAAQANTTKEEFLAQQVMQQMSKLVMILCREKMPKGFLHELEDARNSCSQILAYISNPEDNRVTQVEIEDILLKLAIEAGEYCARGIKRTAKEISSGIIMKASKISEDPLKTYELKIRQHLQFLRQQILQGLYQKMVESVVRLVKEGAGARVSMQNQTTDVHAVAVAQDVHTMDIYYKCLALGFYPLTDNERHLFGIADFTSWALYHPLHQHMYKQYQDMLNQAIKMEGDIYFCNYMRQKLSELHCLSSEQQEELIEKLMYCEEGEKTLESFQRLFFVIQGVMKVNSDYMDWVEFSHASPDIFEEEELKKELAEWEETIKIHLKNIQDSNSHDVGWVELSDLKDDSKMSEEEINQELAEWEQVGVSKFDIQSN